LDAIVITGVAGEDPNAELLRWFAARARGRILNVKVKIEPVL
jgi:hypothetical protein